VAGLVTVEDLIEEIVGEIYDETDRDVLTVEHGPDGAVVVSGRFPVHDLGDLGIDDVPDGPYTTVAGLVLERLGRLPDAPGDRVAVGGWWFEVTAVTGRAITQLRLCAAPEDDGEPGSAAGAGPGSGAGAGSAGTAVPAKHR
jgi:putative hemolysin